MVSPCCDPTYLCRTGLKPHGAVVTSTHDHAGDLRQRGDAFYALWTLTLHRTRPWRRCAPLAASGRINTVRRSPCPARVWRGLSRQQGQSLITTERRGLTLPLAEALRSPRRRRSSWTSPGRGAWTVRPVSQRASWFSTARNLAAYRVSSRRTCASRTATTTACGTAKEMSRPGRSGSDSRSPTGSTWHTTPPQTAPSSCSNAPAQARANSRSVVT